MSGPHRKEFRVDVVAVAREGEASIAEVAKNFGISESHLRNWLAEADVENGRRPGAADHRRARSPVGTGFLLDARRRMAGADSPSPAPKPVASNDPTDQRAEALSSALRAYPLTRELTTR